MTFEYEYTNIKIGPCLYLAIPNIHPFSSVVITLVKNTQFSLVTGVAKCRLLQGPQK